MNLEDDAHSHKPNVQDDWRAVLPPERQELFDRLRAEWEQSFAMLGVALSDALTFRAEGTLVRAREGVTVAQDLAGRLSGRLLQVHDLMDQQGRRGAVPVVDSLQPEDFQGKTGQRCALSNAVFHRLLPFRRRRFLLKVRMLARTLRELSREFHDSAREIAEGTSVEPEVNWKALEVLHHDMHTVVGESTIVLKSFLRSVSQESFLAARNHLPGPGSGPGLQARADFSRAST